ncbi:MAG: hypothetical protein NHB36_11555, partial [Nitrospira sp.]|nr:hypothetical protein [Nitrospira sp.]
MIRPFSIRPEFQTIAGERRDAWLSIDHGEETTRPMKTWSARAILIVALVVLYVLVAFPLPYLLLDHSSAMQAGD